MKRDMELCRLILLEAEKLPPTPAALNEPIEIPGYDHDLVVGHIQVLQDAGFVEAQDWGSMDGVDWRIERLTNAGHDFIDAARDDTLWNRTKTKLGPAFTTVGIKVVGEVLAQIAKTHVMGLLSGR